MSKPHGRTCGKGSENRNACPGNGNRERIRCSVGNRIQNPRPKWSGQLDLSHSQFKSSTESRTTLVLCGNNKKSFLQPKTAQATRVHRTTCPRARRVHVAHGSGLPETRHSLSPLLLPAPAPLGHTCGASFVSRLRHRAPSHLPYVPRIPHQKRGGTLGGKPFLF